MDDVDLIKQGLKARRSGDHALAKSLFKLVVDRKPEQSWARYELVQELRYEGRLTEAIEIAVQGLNEGGSTPQLLCAVGDLFGEAGDLANQVRYLELATLEYPSKAYGWRHYAEYLLKRGAGEAASQLLERAYDQCKDLEQRDLLAEMFAKLENMRQLSNLKVEPWPPTAGDPITNACVVQLVKDEADIIGEQLQHNFLLGFRYFCLIDNSSADSTIEEIRNFQRKHSDVRVVVITDPIPQHYQDHKTTAAAKFAEEYFLSLGSRIEWVFPLDADEFIATSFEGGSLANFLSRMSEKKVIAFPLVNCSSTEPLEVYISGAVYDRFPHVDLVGYKGEVKCAYKFDQKVRLFLGNHFVSNCVSSLDEICIAATSGVYYRHYPFRSIEHTRTKIINGYKSIVEFPDVKGGAHWRQNWELYSAHGDRWLRKYLENYIKKVASGRAE